MPDRAILRTLNELDRWRKRRDELVATRASADELAKVDRQISYYQALAEDMKREVRPATTRDLLSLL
ncbi:MAG TPA: hypothetical protein VM582_06690 [Candidatus Thermoplasmatota archaeon]|nr:hypothetical protein [Candidatus Thermoplasmatota archaeon]